MSLQTRYPVRTTSAFTLIEVLVVVAIIGIAGAIVVPQMLASGTLGVQAAARIVMADIMFAQSDAIAQQEDRKVVFEPDNERYRLTDTGDITLAATWKNGGAGNYVIDFSTDSRFQGVEIVAVNFGGTNELVFDDLGAPSVGGTIDIRFEDQNYRISVASFTGRVSVARI